MRVFAVLGALPAVAAPEPEGQPRAVEPLQDPDFGVSSHALALERMVEMYQWRRDGDGYVAVWSGEPVDSSGFDAGHRNPPQPVQTARWRAEALSLDGHPIDHALLDEVRWEAVDVARAQLPGNMAATFRQDGRHLTTEGDAGPQIGDLRLHWRERVADTPSGLVLADGRWTEAQAEEAEPADEATAATGAPTTSGVVDAETVQPSSLGYWIIGALLVLTLVVVVTTALRRRR